MTYSTINVEEENAGSQDVVYHTIDITSLDSAGFEPYTPETDTNLSGADVVGVSVRGQESPSYLISWDHVNGQLSVYDGADGTTVASGTDVGEVVLEVVGT